MTPPSAISAEVTVKPLLLEFSLDIGCPEQILIFFAVRDYYADTEVCVFERVFNYLPYKPWTVGLLTNEMLQAESEAFQPFAKPLSMSAPCDYAVASVSKLNPALPFNSL